MKTTNKIMEYIKSGFFKGVGLGVGLLTTSIFAAAAAINVFSPGQVISAAQINQNFAIAAPEGAVMAFYLASCPDGWAPADGTNGTPDLRGKFIRGLNDIGTGAPANSLERDPDVRSLGSFQGDIFQSHIHTTTAHMIGGGGGQEASGSNAISVGLISTPVSDGIHGAVRTGDETRPMNISLTYCMRKN